MKKILLLIFSMLFIVITQTTNAIDAPADFEKVKSADTSLKIDWEDVDEALWYYIYYSKSTWIKDWYDFEWEDIIEDSFLKLEELDSDTTYYIAITSVDENWDESSFSDELVYKTMKEGDNWDWSFGLDKVEVNSFSEFKIRFNSDLDSSDEAVRKFRVISKSTWNELTIDKIELLEDESQLWLTVSPDMLSDEEYELTILVLEDIDWRKIGSGINGISNFIVPSDFSVDIDLWDDTSVDVNLWDDTSVKINTWDDDASVDLNAAGTTVKINQWNWWTSVETKDLKVTTTKTAADTKKLPQTWPEHIILLLLALLIWGLVIAYRKKEVNSNV